MIWKKYSKLIDWKQHCASHIFWGQEAQLPPACWLLVDTGSGPGGALPGQFHYVTASCIYSKSARVQANKFKTKKSDSFYSLILWSHCFIHLEKSQSYWSSKKEKYPKVWERRTQALRGHLQSTRLYFQLLQRLRQEDALSQRVRGQPEQHQWKFV